MWAFPGHPLPVASRRRLSLFALGHGLQEGVGELAPLLWGGSVHVNLKVLVRREAERLLWQRSRPVLVEGRGAL